MAIDKVSGTSFDSERLARVGQRIKEDISASRRHGAALIFAHRGDVVIDLVEALRIAARAAVSAGKTRNDVGRQAVHVGPRRNLRSKSKEARP